LREAPVACDLIGGEDRAVRAAAALHALSTRLAGAGISRIMALPESIMALPAFF
jgi:hypothetical protein